MITCFFLFSWNQMYRYEFNHICGFVKGKSQKQSAKALEGLCKGNGVMLDCEILNA